MNVQQTGGTIVLVDHEQQGDRPLFPFFHDPQGGDGQGVGIDGGQVFYGTLGSYVRMTNTVIGDNVNAASRLEGLTRVYKIPVICSKFVMEDIKNNVADHGIEFHEIDTVQVKGKTTGKKVFWPITNELYTDDLKNQMDPLNLR